MEKLSEIPSVILRDDGWEYSITAFEDDVYVEYRENSIGNVEKKDSFTIPTYCAEQVCDAIIDLLKRREK